MIDQFAGHILLLSGSPGSGKTTTAEALARLPGRPKVHLHTDDFWGYIKTGKIDPWLAEADAQNAMVMEIAAGVAARYAQSGYFVALDGVIRPAMLHHYRQSGIPTHYIVLRTDAAEAVARCAARGGDSLTDADVVTDLHHQFSRLAPFEHHALDVSGLSRQQTLDRVAAALVSGAFRLSPEPSGAR